MSSVFILSMLTSIKTIVVKALSSGPESIVWWVSVIEVDSYKIYSMSRISVWFILSFILWLGLPEIPLEERRRNSLTPVSYTHLYWWNNQPSLVLVLVFKKIVSVLLVICTLQLVGVRYSYLICIITFISGDCVRSTI